MPKWDKAPPETSFAGEERTLDECEKDTNGHEKGAEMEQTVMHKSSSKLRPKQYQKQLKKEDRFMIQKY